MIFTFEKNLTKDITKVNDKVGAIDEIIKDLACFQGVEYIPTFRFFQIKKSIIKS